MLWKVPAQGRVGAVTVYTWATREDLVEQALGTGAHGWLSKSLDAEAIVDALERLAAGEQVVLLGEVATVGDDPEQSRDDPLGLRGPELHGWHIGDPRATEADSTANGWLMRPRGAYVMGRNMFGPVRGEWNETWEGWWGPEPPYHAPVFVLTHYAHAPITMKGGTTFHFVNSGLESALSQAREAAGDRDVRIAGGGATILEYVNAGLIDEFSIALSPVLFGSGIRLFDGVDAGRVALEPVRAEPTQRVTHLTYAVRER